MIKWKLGERPDSVSCLAGVSYRKETRKRGGIVPLYQAVSLPHRTSGLYSYISRNRGKCRRWEGVMCEKSRCLSILRVYCITPRGLREVLDRYQTGETKAGAAPGLRRETKGDHRH